MSDKPRKPLPDDKKKPAEKPVSLAPLKFQEAVEGLLKTETRKVEERNLGRKPTSLKNDG